MWRPMNARGLPQRRLLLAGLLAILPVGLAGQTPQAASAAGPAATFLERYNELMKLAPLAGQVADVHHLVLRRDAGQLVLEQGKLYLLSRIGGRTVGAVFEGTGRFTLTPPLPAEQAELHRFAHATTLDDSIHEVILIFADSTAAQIGALTFGPADVPGEVGNHVDAFVGSLKGDKDGSYDPGVMEPLLNGDTTGYFLARLAPDRGDAVLFELNPGASEEVTLYRPVSHARWHTSWTPVTRFAAQGRSVSPADWRGPRDRLRVPRYQLDVQIKEGFNADLLVDAAAILTTVDREPVGPWLNFKLAPKLTLDSARWGDGAPAATFKAEEDEDAWVRVGHRLRAGDTLALTLFYHGDVFRRWLDWFLIEPGLPWFPFNGQGSTVSTFDLTYHSPSQYTLVSVGERGDSSAAGRITTAHWTQRLPTDQATFNVGLFDLYHAQFEGAPAVDVLISEAAHRQIRQRTRGTMVEQGNKSETVAVDVSNSLKLYASLFGRCTYDHFFVTEIPYAEGVSFPGMIDLSASTFQNTSLDGFDEYFRAHEAAHQWWGNGVRPASYRDVWLNEGLADFSALWYLQVERKSSQQYFKFLDQYAADIRTDKDDVGPIWLGWRNLSPDLPRGYQVIVYEKGAWVFNMLRVLMLDLRTMSDDRFTAMMRDYYQTFLGRPATTADFQHVVEQHLGMPMDWFFDEWVKGTDIPTYHVRWKSEPAEGGRFRIRFRIGQDNVSPGFRMPVLVAADLGENRVAHFRLDVTGAQGEYLSPLLPAEARSVTFNDLHAVLADVKMDGSF